MVLQIGVALAITLQAPCDLGPFWEGPTMDESVILARATGTQTEVFSPSGLSWFAVSGTVVTAWEFVVEAATRSDPAEEEWGVLAPGQRFLAVPWEFDASCDPVPWRFSEWIGEGTEVVFRVSSARVHQGTRLLDINASHWPYPVAPFVPEGYRTEAPEDRRQWLSPLDFFRVLSAAPRSREGPPASAEVERLEMHYRAGPTYLLERFPGPQLLDHLRGERAGPAF